MCFSRLHFAQKYFERRRLCLHCPGGASAIKHQKSIFLSRGQCKCFTRAGQKGLECVSWLLAFCPHSSAQPVTSNLSVWELKRKRGSSDFSPIASPHSCIGMKLLIELISAVHSLSHTLLMIYDAQTGRPPSLIQNKPGISLRESWGDYKTGSLCAARTGRSFRNIHTLVDKSLL